MPALRFFTYILEYGVYLFVFLLPWQARLILREGSLNGGYWEYGTVSLYAVDLLFLALLIVFILLQWRDKTKLWQNVLTQKLWLVAVFFIAWWNILMIATDAQSNTPYQILRLFEVALFMGMIRWGPVNIQRLSFAFLTGAVIQAMIGINQFILQESMGPNKWLGVSGHDPSQLGTAVVDTGWYRWLRAYGTLPHPNMLGGFLALALIIAAEWYFDLQRRVLQASAAASAAVKRLRAEMTGCIRAFVILLAGLAASVSRSAAIGAFIGLGLYGFLRWKIGPSEIKRAVKIASGKLLLIGGILVVILGLTYLSVFYTRAIADGRLEAKSLSERGAQFSQAWEIIKQHPIGGVGLGNYTSALSQLIPEQPSWYYQPVHNIYLLLIAELGMLGWLIIAGLGYWMWREWRKIRSGSLGASQWAYLYFSMLCILLIIGLFDHYLLSLPFGLWLIGLAVGVYLRSSKGTLPF